MDSTKSQPTKAQKWFRAKLIASVLTIPSAIIFFLALLALALGQTKFDEFWEKVPLHNAIDAIFDAGGDTIAILFLIATVVSLIALIFTGGLVKFFKFVFSVLAAIAIIPLIGIVLDILLVVFAIILMFAIAPILCVIAAYSRYKEDLEYELESQAYIIEEPINTAPHSDTSELQN